MASSSAQGNQEDFLYRPLTRLFVKRKLWEAALTLLDLWETNLPDTAPEARARRGWVYLQTDQLDQARETFEKLVSHSPQHQAAKRSLDLISGKSRGYLHDSGLDLNLGLGEVYLLQHFLQALQGSLQIRYEQCVGPFVNDQRCLVREKGTVLLNLFREGLYIGIVEPPYQSSSGCRLFPCFTAPSVRFILSPGGLVRHDSHQLAALGLDQLVALQHGLQDPSRSHPGDVEGECPLDIGIY